MDNNIQSILHYPTNGFSSVGHHHHHHYGTKSIQQHSPHSSIPNISTENVGDIYSPGGPSPFNTSFNIGGGYINYSSSNSNSSNNSSSTPYYSPMQTSSQNYNSNNHHYNDNCNNNQNHSNMIPLNDLHYNSNSNSNNNSNSNSNNSSQPNNNLPPLPTFPSLNDSSNSITTSNNSIVNNSHHHNHPHNNHASSSNSGNHANQTGNNTPSTTPTQSNIASQPSTPSITPTQRPPFPGGQSSFYNQFQSHLDSKLTNFWSGQVKDINKTEDFKNHELPLARIKKIMKSDKDVNKISSEAPILFAKACEILILEMTHRSWIHTELNKRRTLQRTDIINSLSKCETFDFLIDMLPREEIKASKKILDEYSRAQSIPPEYVQQYLQYQMATENQMYKNINPNHPNYNSISPSQPQNHQFHIINQNQIAGMKRSYSMEIHSGGSSSSSPNNNSQSLKKRSNSQDYNFHFNEYQQQQQNSQHQQQLNQQAQAQAQQQLQLQQQQLQQATQNNLSNSFSDSNIATSSSHHSSFDYSFNDQNTSSDEHQFHLNDSSSHLNLSNEHSSLSISPNNELSSSPSSQIYSYSP